jgi:enoyl-CoA hydratase/carnithine racemase
MGAIDWTISGHVGRVTIDRPEVRNALDVAAEDELAAVMRRLDADPDVRVVVLTGAGDRAFCAGSDLRNEQRSGLEYFAYQHVAGFGGLGAATDLSVPIVARVNGYALGGGFELVLGCDLVVACEEALLGLPEPTVGYLPLGGGVVQLTRRLPHALAMEMFLTARRLSAREAQELGLVNEVVPRAELDAAVERLIERVLACAPLALRAIKQLSVQTRHLPLDEAMQHRSLAVMRALGSHDAIEGPRAFREKRPPRWQGV